MTTYFHGSSEIQEAASSDGNGIQTLYLMNPNYQPSYSDTTVTQEQNHHHHPPNMFFFNPTLSTPHNPLTLPRAPPSNHQLVGIPLPSNITSTNQDNPIRSTSNGVVSAGFHNNLWGSIDHNSVAASDSGGIPDVVSSPIGFRRSGFVSPGRRGLSLSLSSQQVQTSTPLRHINDEQHEIQAMHGHYVSALSSSDDLRISRNSPSSVSAMPNGVSGTPKMVLGSKYIRAAQELLDEVANVGKVMKDDLAEGAKGKMKMNKESKIKEGSVGDGSQYSVKRGTELTTAQRQELQMKKAKLLNMLDEVEERYRQYHHQIQIVVSSFEQAAGLEAAKSYTARALETISKQFRCLKDTISGQVKATSKSLGEEDCLGLEGSRLRYVDHRLRQQRALQQLNMVQHSAWKPQRGLPERAVSVLRAWLFEHFLHPYPKDSDKHMLAKQTGLARSQVSNWFINARVRLWKPMVEEMYLEEIKEQEKTGRDHQENPSKYANKESGPDDTQSKHADAPPPEFSNSTISNIHPQSGFSLIRPSEMEGISQRSPKKPRSSDMQNNSPISILSMDTNMKHGEPSRDMIINFGGDRLSKDGYPLMTGITNQHGIEFGAAYPIGGLDRSTPHEQLMTPRFGGNSVSLTLGLQHCENLPLSRTPQSYISNQSIQLGRRLELGADETDFRGINSMQNSHSSTGFETISTQNRNRFAAQLLQDFVA
ncbi:hypothetical protein K2173_021245 [Erythroxylum novogranatense]|uniref:Homeobox domain-containing protein n=1 Tax=Erythroxylum novogranatense TaxID=1862640 RepID=A0AAV8TPX7_9ROSI|nr:hypothetical protein K2173_021245 [Erythroxylum novogranatense]